MRVLHCIWRMSIGGSERQLVRLAAGLVGRDIEVHVATAFPAALDADLAATGAAVHHVHASGKYDPLVFVRLLSLCRTLRPDVIQTHLTQMDIVGGLVAKVLDIPWILSERSSALAYPPTLFNRVRSAVGAHAGLIVANSEVGSQYWSDIAPARLRVIPNIIPQAEVDAARAFGNDEIGVAANDQVVLCVGRFSAEKNLRTLVTAVAQIAESQRPVFVFLGDGPLRGEIERMATEAGIEGRTRFAGNTTNVFPWMKRADAMISVSLFEGNPNAVLEAIAAGTPLVVSDIPGHRAVLDDSSAWFVDPRDPASIAAGLRAALANGEEARARASRARAVATSRSADEIAALYENAYGELSARSKDKGERA